MSGSGIASLDFGAFPGASDASLAITGQASISSTSLVEAWLIPTATADHSADEHWLETIKVMAGNISAGVGFTIYGVNTSQLNEPLEPGGRGRAATAVVGAQAEHNWGGLGGNGGRGTRIYGTWNVGWVWN